ncbi:LysR family transcriptional regulator [Geobacter pickeringii]|uniref:LysR family transcriptional regulator n=1 Tax=Geobacter pickeringii TaxID=345632 RepID=A0A0B5BC77_9BACT|nr:LysR family transcriptional regulator [Geobacter pickeringii]AJE04318.1 LysR family transcriptional regulator [Geobacter pickeringii]
MDLRQLRFFVEIARHGNFTKAAEQLHVAQPAVSMAIKKLEEELDLVLFSRQERKVALTAEGKIFLAHARRVLAEVKAAEMEMGELHGLSKGEVRVGIPPMLSAYYFPDIIRDFVRRYPNLHLSVYGEGAWRIQKMIEQGELDMGVIAAGIYPENLEVRRFLREEVVVCVPKGHSFAGRKAVSFDEFMQQPLVFYKEGYYIRELIFDVTKGTGIAPNIVFETNLFSLVKSLVRNGLGISTFLRMVVSNDEDLRAVSFDPPLYLDLLIAWKKLGYLSRANRAFVDFLLDQTKDIP